jgi:hypothetical protein
MAWPARFAVSAFPRGRGPCKRRRRRVGRLARVRTGQRHRSHGQRDRDLAVHRHPAGQPHRRAPRPALGSGQLLSAPYIAIEAIRALAAGDRAETSVVGLVLTAGTAVFEPALGIAKRRIGARLGSSATAGEGTQNLLCAYLAIAVFTGLAANTLLGAWWLDGAVAVGIAGWAVVEGRRAWAGKSCGCTCQPTAQR